MRLVYVALVCFVATTTAHVRLTYPLARTFDFDFLDNVRTNGPCGMEATEDTPVTVFQQNAKIMVTWHLAYSHRGGFKIQLLDFSNNETEIVANLTGNNGDFIANDSITTTEHEVTLPVDLKGAYTLQLLRHAAEWTAGGDKYMFWSCADIMIEAKSFCNGDTCSDQGTCVNETCECNNLASGDVCQYKDECTGPGDCNDHGECWQISSTTYPRNQCFCEQGYYGIQCKKENPADFSLDDFDKSKFFAVDLSDSVVMYYKVWENVGEVEIRVEADSSTSWVAVGWKPTDLTEMCRNFPVEYQTGIPVPETEPEATTPAPSNQQMNKRRRRSLREGVVPLEETVLQYDPDWNCEDDGLWTHPDSEPEGEPPAVGEPVPEGEPEGEPTGEPEPAGNLHPMDCVDVVIGRAKGNYGNVLDYYTRDRSTPRYDEFYGGTQDLIAASAKEEDGKTIIHFRRKLKTDDTADHDIAFRDDMQVIWARGQEFGYYVHNPGSGLESCEAKDNKEYLFYRKDDIRYHGTNDLQRSLIPNLNFYRDFNEPSDGQCVGQLRQPSDCQGDGCAWMANWVYNDSTDLIDFTIVAKLEDQGRWTGIGFSQDGTMINSDAVIGWVTASGETDIKDYFLGGKSAAGVVQDTSQDIMDDASVTYKDGFLTLKFKRKRNTGDTSQDLSFEDNCLRILQPDSGGMFNNAVQYHTGTPNVSQLICIATCTARTILPSTLLLMIVYVCSSLLKA